MNGKSCPRGLVLARDSLRAAEPMFQFSAARRGHSPPYTHHQSLYQLQTLQLHPIYLNPDEQMKENTRKCRYFCKPWHKTQSDDCRKSNIWATWKLNFSQSVVTFLNLLFSEDNPLKTAVTWRFMLTGIPTDITSMFWATLGMKPITSTLNLSQYNYG